MMKDFNSWSEEEKEWRGRDDARTLANAEAIRADKNRYNNARNKAKEMATASIKEAKGMSKVAGMKVSGISADSNSVFNKGSYSNPATLKRL